MDKIRILFTYANTEELGGADYCLLKLAAALDQSLFDIHIALSKKNSLEDLCKKNNIKVHYVGMPRLQITVNPLKIISYFVTGLSSILTLKKIIKEEKIDIVHGNDLLDVWGPFAGTITGIITVQHIRMILPKGVINSIFSRIISLVNDKVICVSEGTLVHLFGARNLLKKVLVLYDWLNPVLVGHTSNFLPFRQEMGISDDILVIGVVGRLQKWKGQHLFLKAGKEILQVFPDARLVVCGGQVHGRHKKYGESLRKLASDLGISEKVFFTGQRFDVINLISSFDLFIHSSITPDPLPGVIMEASFCGVPVLGPRAGGVPEEIGDGFTGYLYSPGDDKDLVQKACAMLSLNKLERRALGQNGCAYVRSKFNGAKIIKQFQEVYISLIREKYGIS